MTEKLNITGEDDFYTFRVRKSGPEAIAAGSVVSADISGDASIGIEGTVEHSIGGLGVLALYQMTLTYLSLQRDVAEGRLTRQAQVKRSLADGWAACKDGAVYVVAVSGLLAFFPVLGLPATLAAIVGGVSMSAKLGRAFWDALSDEQQANLKSAADDAGVAIDNITGRQTTAEAPAA